MLSCKRCRVSYTGYLKECPLCQGPLEGDAVPPVFPHNSVTRPKRVMLALVTIFSVVAILAMAFLWMAGVVPGTISVLVMVLVAGNYLFLRNILRFDPGFIRGAQRYLLVLILLSLAAYLITKSTFFTGILLPAICLCSLGFDVVALIVLKAPFVRDYAKYLIFDALFSYVPLIMTLCSLAGHSVLGYINAFCASAFLVVLWVLFRKELTMEARRLLDN